VGGWGVGGEGWFPRFEAGVQLVTNIANAAYTSLIAKPFYIFLFITPSHERQIERIPSPKTLQLSKCTHRFSNNALLIVKRVNDERSCNVTL
jgi:hypothetical protein